MKNILLIGMLSLGLVSCGGGRHEPEVIDSRLIQAKDSNAGREIIDSINSKGSTAKTDTADSAKPARRKN